uniref:Ipi1_N domain-containing protein n=1 Tax=Rhabditophanes sp. KR3021 TaxID=114890 RepID=A0AC35TI56_9BILA
MPKSRVGIRKKNEAFKKTKIKPGHVLKKTNVTDTRFVAKQLSLIEQLQAKKSEVVSYRGLTLGDLFKQMGHHNLNIRRDAVVGTKELLKSNPVLMNRQMMNIIPAVARLIPDPKNDTHMTAQLRLLLDMICETSELEMNPHFSLFMSHVLCGFTHLQQSVKAFALDVMNMLMDKYPNLCRKSDDLFQSYIKFISGHRKPHNKQMLVYSIQLFLKVYKKSNEEKGQALFSAELNYEKATCDQINLILPTNPFDFPILGSLLSDETSPLDTESGEKQTTEIIMPYLKALLSVH